MSAQTLQGLDDLHEVHVLHHVVVVAVLLTLVVEHRPELYGCQGLYGPYDGCLLVVELEDGGVGLQRCLARHE